MEPITLKFTHNEEAYVSAHQYSYLHLRRIRFFLGFLVLCLIVSIVVSLGTKDAVPAIAVTFYCVIIMAIFLYMYLFFPRRRFRSEPKFRNAVLIEISESGITTKTEGLQTQVEWSYYLKFAESEKAFLLYPQKNLYAIFPKSAFNSKEQEALFRKLLNAKVSRRV